MIRLISRQFSSEPFECFVNADDQKKAQDGNQKKTLSKRSEGRVFGGLVGKNVSFNGPGSAAALQPAKFDGVLQCALGAAGHKKTSDSRKGLSALSAESEKKSAEPTVNELATETLDRVEERPLVQVGLKEKLEDDLNIYYGTRPKKLSVDTKKLKEFMSVGAEGRISVFDESNTQEGFVKFFTAVTQAGHAKKGELVKLLINRYKDFFSEDYTFAVLPRVCPEVNQPLSHDIPAAVADSSQEVVSDQLMYVYISMLTKYLWTKDGVSFGAYEAGHAQRIEQAFEKSPEIKKILSLVPYDVIHKGKTENRLRVELNNSASLKRSDVEAMYKALANGHDSKGPFFKLLGNFDFVALKQQVMNPDELAKKATEATVGWYKLWVSDSCTVDTVNAFRELLQQLKMADSNNQPVLGTELLENLIKAFGHLDEQMKSVERDATKLHARYVPKAGHGGLPEILEYSKSGAQVSAVVDGFRRGLERLGNKTVDMLNGALEKLEKEFGAKQVAEKTTEQVNALLGRASSGFKAQYPKWTNLYPQALSESNTGLIFQHANAFNAAVREKIFNTCMNSYMAVVKKGVEEFSCDAVDNNVHTRGVFPLVMKVHAELGSVPDRAMEKLDELVRITGCVGVSIDEQKKKFTDDLQLQLKEKFDVEVGSATKRWVKKLQSLATTSDMQDRINALAERVPILHQQLEDLNRQTFLNDGSRQVLRKHIGQLVNVDVTKDLQKPGVLKAIRRGWRQSFDLRAKNVVAGVVGAATGIVVGSQLPKPLRVPVVAIGSAIAALKWGVIGILKSLGERKNAVTQIESIQNAWKAIERMAVPTQASEMPQR